MLMLWNVQLSNFTRIARFEGHLHWGLFDVQPREDSTFKLIFCPLKALTLIDSYAARL